MERMKRVIFNADDFGISEQCTDAIVESFNKGYLDYSSIMVNTHDFARAHEIAKEKGFKDKIGLHLNLSEGVPITEDIKKDKLFCNPETGCFNRAFQNKLLYRIILPRNSRKNLKQEIEAQISKFLLHGFYPIYLDSHHHVHKELSIMFILFPIMKKNGFSSVRIAKNTGKSIKNYINRFINFVILLYPGINKKSDYLFQSLAEFEGINIKGTVEIEVHPNYLGKQIIDQTIKKDFIRSMDVINKFKS